MHLLAGVDVRTVQPALGHSDLETITSYLKAISGKQKGVRERMDATFAEIAVQPMQQSQEATIHKPARFPCSSLPCHGQAVLLQSAQFQGGTRTAVNV
jgi:hypothetical protein